MPSDGMSHAQPNMPQSAVTIPGGEQPRKGQPIVVTVGKPLPRHPSYARYCKKWLFFEHSYKGGPRYRDCNDPDGLPVLVPHEQESTKSFERRKRMSAYHNFCKPITDKLLGFVFSKPVIRDPDKQFTTWSEDVDGHGQQLHEYMRRVTLKAAILDRWFIQVDTNKPSDGMTQEQAKSMGARLMVSDVHPTRVINWVKDYSGESGDDDESGEQYLITDDALGQWGGARLWTGTGYQLVLLDRDGVVESVAPEVPHGYDEMPIIKVKAHASHQALIEDVSMLSLQVYNLDSWLMEELCKQTFSQWWAAGAGLTPESLASVDVGSRKVIVLNMDANSIKFERLASDPSQAQSIRDTIAQKVQEIYRAVGLKDPTIEQGRPESGIALKIRFTDISYKAAELADMAEQAEQKIVALYNSAMGASIEDPEYPEDFDEDDIAAELKLTLDTIAADMPMGVKRAQVRLYAEKALTGEVDDAEMTEIKQEIEAKYATPDVVEPTTGMPQGPAGNVGPPGSEGPKGDLRLEAAKELAEHQKTVAM